MGKHLFDEFPELVECASDLLGYSIKELCLEDRDGLLDQTEYSQPALYVVNALHYLHARRESEAGPDHVAGFSLGEYNALLAAHAFDFASGLKIVQQRAHFMGQARGGAMAAVVGLAETELRNQLARYCARDLTLANHNTPHQFVLSGSKAELERLKPFFSKMPGVELFAMLKTSGAFHSPAMSEAQQQFEGFLEGVALAELALPVISNVTARPYERDDVKSLMAKQITHPVRWTDTIAYLLDQGVEEFVEVGEGGVLARLIEKIKQDPDTPRTRSGPGLNAAPADPAAVSPGTPSPLLATIQARCAARPDKELLIYHDEAGTQAISGAALARKLAAAGSALTAHVAAQDRVVLLFPQGFHYGLGLLACWYANAVAVPTSITDPAELDQKRELLQAVMGGCGARFVLTSTLFEETVRTLVAPWGCQVLNIEDLTAGAAAVAPPRRCRHDDLALLLYTSGSTAQPKGVMLSHEAIRNSATSPLWGLSEQSRVVSWLPQFHAFGICLGLLSPLAHGATSIVFPPAQFVANPVLWFELIDRYQATHTGAPNFVFDYCCKSIDDDALSRLSLRSLQALACGGDVIHKEAYDRFVTRFATSTGLSPDVLAPNYGLSEAGPVTLKAPGQPISVMTLDRDALQAGRVSSAEGGKAIVGCGECDPRTRIVIVDPETRQPCPADRVGEVWLKGPVVAQGYFNNAEQTEVTFNGVLSNTGEGGFLRTGDLGFVADRQLYLVGREKDVIVVHGKKHHSSDIETSIRNGVQACHGACAVFAVEQEGGEGMRVVVVQEMPRGLDARFYERTHDEIVTCVSALYQIEIHDLVFIPTGTMPVTGSRKVRRKACRQNYEAALLEVLWCKAQAPVAPVEAVTSRDTTELANVIAVLKQRVLLPELGARAAQLQAGTTFSQLGLDSIRYIRLARKIESIFQVPFKPGQLFKHSTCEALAHHLLQQQTEPTRDVLYPQWRAYRDEGVQRLLDDCLHGRATLQQTLKSIKEGA
ncbi:ACP S-malonyltransferase [Caldimonas brevitalea]|uniref:Malonyl CoA-acyl carrier protein transacylase n=1 Tax=Caldimonas brevitalea TaxID=413882 RepID=A0A0G3BN56_9BURK|nr:malonyl CoA-acyl carrier protein transacylase [Caldimonas brevitalea]